MGRYIIKPELDTDFYVEWSTVVDGPIQWGTRQEFVDAKFDEDRLLRADQFGTSAFDIPRHLDNPDDGEIYLQIGWLKFSNMKQLLELLEKNPGWANDPSPEVLALLDPLED